MRLNAKNIVFLDIGELLPLVKILQLLFGEYVHKQESDCSEVSNSKIAEHCQLQKVLDNMCDLLTKEVKTGKQVEELRQEADESRQRKTDLVQSIKDEMRDHEIDMKQRFADMDVTMDRLGVKRNPPIIYSKDW